MSAGNVDDLEKLSRVQWKAEWMTTFDPAMMNATSSTVLWEAVSSDMANMASGGKVKSASYRLTEDAIQFSSGIMSSREETVPLWAVRDVDVIQTMTQKARGVSDLHLKLDPAAGVYGQSVLVLKSIRDGKAIRDLVLRQANEVRNYWNQRRHDLDVERQRASASQIFAPAPPASAAPQSAPNDLMSQLAKLGEMKQAGLLSEEEFAAAKARLLG
jgi:1,2-phenylacetyl-CoA epoxidase PaaB subunit